MQIKIIIMALTKETLSSIMRHIFPRLKAQLIYCKMKPAVICPQLHLSPLSFCAHASNLQTRLFHKQRIKRNEFLMPTFCSDNLLLERLFTGSPVNNTRCYHSRSKLSVQEDVFVSYLQNIVYELKELEEEQLKSNHSFRTEKEEKLLVARHQFLVSANDVITRLFEKQSEVTELKSLLSDETEADMKTMMKNEIEMLGKNIHLLEDELIEVLAGNEPADNNDIILEVSAGVGGQEAMLFCAEVFNMYCQYGLGKGWNVALVDKDENELGGYRKASIEISGFDVYKWLKFEAGVHRVQRVPKTERAGRVHTSTVTVSILPQPREIYVEIEKKDLKIETYRASGPGGQSVNTTDSAVRITHLPTGTVAECKKERSQIKNKEYAMKVLKTRIYQAQLEEEETNRRATRKMQIGSRGRSEKIRTYNYQQDRVTDHRVKENYSNLPEFMAGGEGLEDLMSVLEKDFKCKVVESMVDEFELSLKKGVNK